MEREKIQNMSNLWDRLQALELTSQDFYEFEERFEQEINTLEQQTLQDNWQ
jgi:hypothetical protein